MSPFRTVYVPCFSSQLGSSQRDEQDYTTEQTETPTQHQEDKGGNKRGKVRREKTRSVLKVKLPVVNKKGAKEDKTPRRWMLEPAANKTKTPVSRRGGGGGAQCADTDSVDGDTFSFSQRPTSKAVNEKEKTKLAVLRTISKMLEENQLIRQRLAALSQAT